MLPLSAEEEEKRVWQEKCTAEFLRCLDIPSHDESRKAWADRKIELDREGKKVRAQRQIVVGHWGAGNFFSLIDRDLSNFDFRFIYFARVDFSNSRLVRTSFAKSNLLDCRITRCDVSHASFEGAHASQGTSFKLNIGVDKANIDFITSPSALKNFDPLVIRYLQDKEQIAAFRSYNRDPVAWVANKLTDYGRGFAPLALTSTLLIVIFGLLYAFLIKPEGRRSGIWTLGIEAVDESFKRFFNLAPSEPRVGLLVHVLFSVEGFLGILALGLFVAVLVSKLVRR